MDDLFVEVTGTVLDHVLLTANILAANLRDRGAAIHPVATVYPFDTPRGREVATPHPLPEKRLLSVGLERFRTVLGEPALGADDVRANLRAYGLAVSDEGGRVRVEAPPWRCDYLHEVDAVEDFAISRGYESFTARMPEEFTVGRLASSTDLADRARDRLIGYGFEEAITNILTEERLLRAAMNLAEGFSGASRFPGREMVRIANVMNASYACLRDWLLPSLLEVESHSAGAVYPHRIFEAGEVAVLDPSAPLRSQTEQRVAGLVAHELASFTEAQAYLNLLLRHLGATDYTLEPAEHPTFLPGRFAFVQLPGSKDAVGVVGELHPEVLAGEQGFGIRVPCSAFELALAPFGSGVGASRRPS
jgi:phenylalanyl-tRNA synthetase beta chain